VTEKRRKIAVFGILILAVIWGVWNNPFASHGKSDREVSDSMALSDPDPTTPVAVAGVTVAAGQDVIGWQGDPFSRKKRTSVSRRAPVVAARTDFRVSAISSQGGEYMAVVNGKVVQKGDLIAGWTVAEIEELSVLLTRGSERLKLTMKRS